MTLHVNHAGTWKDATPYVKDAGTWKPIQELYVREAGTWKLVYTAQVVVTQNLSAGNYSGTFVTATVADIQVTATGAPITLRLQANLDHAANGTNGGITQEIKLQYNSTGTTWVDVGAVQSASSSEPIIDVETQQRGYVGGTVDYTVSHTPPAGACKYRAVVRRSSGTKSASVNGTASATL